MRLAQQPERPQPGAWLFSRLARILLALSAAVATVPLAALPAGAAPGDPVLYDQVDARISWSGAWATTAAVDASGGSQAFTNSAGASASFAFYGTQVDLIGMVGPKCGVASVVLDGGAPVAVDFYAPATSFGQSALSLSGLSDGLHTLTMTCSGSKQAASADTFVSLDAVRVCGELVGYPVEQTDGRIVRRGAWMTSTAPGLSGGSQLLAGAAGSQIAIAFTGTQLELIGMTGPKCGIAEVSIDGGATIRVDLYRPNTTLRERFCSIPALPGGAHTVTITCTGQKNALASDSFVSLDSVLVSGTLTQALLRYEETEPRLGWNGALTAADAAGPSGSRYVWAGPSWGACSASFVGSRLDWVAVTGPQYGIAAVSVDGGPVGYVDLYAPEVRCQQVVYSTGALAYGQHNVTISWTSQRNPASTGTYLSFDAFDIAGEAVQAPAPQQPVVVTFNYPWHRYIVVDKSDLRLYYVIDGALVASYPVATGRPSMPTPSAIWRIDAKYYTDPTSVYGPRKMRLFRQSGGGYVFTAYAIHGTDTDSSIGTYASHGCIRMHNYDVVVFFDQVPLGTMVVTRD